MSHRNGGQKVHRFKESIERTSRRILVLCVDRDNDLAKSAELKTPILGRDGNIMAGLTIALRAPEKANANSMFKAIGIYDDLVEDMGDDLVQIATISGSENIEWADRKMVVELTEVLKCFPAKGVVLVTDGSVDEAVWPVIQSRIPIDSMRRVVVKQEDVKVDEIYRLVKSVEKYTRPPTLRQRTKSEIFSGIIGWIIALILGALLLLVLALR